jgi:hypothetical protein
MQAPFPPTCHRASLPLLELLQHYPAAGLQAPGQQAAQSGLQAISADASSKPGQRQGAAAAACCLSAGMPVPLQLGSRHRCKPHLRQQAAPQDGLVTHKPLRRLQAREYQSEG